MKKEFLELLVHPITKQQLRYSEVKDHKILTDILGNEFNFIKDVPVLFEKSEIPSNEFDYQEHYIKDAETYDYFEEWNAVSKEENNRLHQHILSQIPKETNWILDVGSGNAWLANELSKKKRKIISMDISLINPVKAIETYPSPYHFGLVADVYNLPFRENSIDCIVAAEIIEHLPDPESFLNRLLYILKPNGTLIVTTPFNEKIQQSLCIHCNELTPHNAHLNSFTVEKLKALIPSQHTTSFNIFNNKILVQLRIQKLFKFLPLKAWNILDKLVVKLNKSAFRLMMVVHKK